MTQSKKLQQFLDGCQCDGWQALFNRFFFYELWGGAARRASPELWQNEAFCEWVLWASRMHSDDPSEVFWGILDYFPESFVKKHQLRTTEYYVKRAELGLGTLEEIPDELWSADICAAALGNRDYFTENFYAIPERLKTWDLCVLYVQFCLEDSFWESLDKPWGIIKYIPLEFRDDIKRYYKGYYKENKKENKK
jgi:hypothetical protein